MVLEITIFPWIPWKFLELFWNYAKDPHAKRKLLIFKNFLVKSGKNEGRIGFKKLSFQNLWRFAPNADWGAYSAPKNPQLCLRCAERYICHVVTGSARMQIATNKSLNFQKKSLKSPWIQFEKIASHPGKNIIPTPR